jgi:hypothetical protein
MSARKKSGRTAVVVAALVAGAVIVVPSTARADGTVVVSNATEFVNAFQDATTDRIELAADIALGGAAVRPNAADPLVIDGFGFTLSTSANSRILETFAATGALTVENLTVTGSNPTLGQGGAIRWIGGDVTVRNSAFVNNDAVSQGAAILMDGILVIENSTFDDTNTGAIFGAASVTATDSTFTNNLGTGAIAAMDVSATRSTFIGNEGVVGGAIQASASLTLIDSTVSGNSAFTVGGGFAAGGELALINSTVNGNEAGAQGGGVYNIGTSTRIENSTITGNTATGAGGGVFYAGEASIVYSTIVGNDSPDGANISSFVDEGTLEVFGSVVGQSVDGNDNCTNVGSNTSAGYAYEEGADSCGFGNGAGDVTDGADPQLGPLAANGGLTETLLPLAGSPLIDAIPDSACTSGPATGVTTDQRGVTRPQGSGCDIGAVEVGTEEPPGPSAPGPGTPGEPVSPRFTG